MTIGSSVEVQTVVCIIEAMKLMNEIQAETTGEVVKIYVENGQPVEYGQPLFGIKIVDRSKVRSPMSKALLLATTTFDSGFGLLDNI